MTNKTIITCDNSAFSFMGRIDFSEPKAPLFTYAGCMATVGFTGKEAGMLIKPVMFYEKSWIGAIVDGIQYTFEITKSDEPVYIPIVDNLEEGEHTLTIFKRTAGSHYFNLCGVVLANGENVLPVTKNYNMNIEVYGDSVSAGEVVEAVYFEGHCDPENHEGVYDNSWFSYSLSLGRKLNACVHCNSQGGIALFDGTGYFSFPDYCGLESTYDKMAYVPTAPTTRWDFSRFKADLVIMAIGQNDPNPNPELIKTAEYRKKWKDKYISIIRDLQSKHNHPKFILILTVLMHDSEWDTVLDEVCRELNDEDIVRFRFRRNGAATPGHPRITEQEEMAGELYNFINNWCKSE